MNGTCVGAQACGSSPPQGQPLCSPELCLIPPLSTSLGALLWLLHPLQSNSSVGGNLSLFVSDGHLLEKIVLCRLPGFALKLASHCWGSRVGLLDMAHEHPPLALRVWGDYVTYHFSLTQPSNLVIKLCRLLLRFRPSLQHTNTHPFPSSILMSLSRNTTLVISLLLFTTFSNSDAHWRKLSIHSLHGPAIPFDCFFSLFLFSFFIS